MSLLLTPGAVSGAAITKLLEYDLAATLTARFILTSVNVQQILEVAILSVGALVIRNRRSKVDYAIMQHVFQCLCES